MTVSSVLDPALHDSLRTLKLSGMLETLDARLAQARGGDLGHLDFLQVLCDDEITRREQQAIARRIRRAQFESTQATLESFDFAAAPKLPAAQIRDLAALRWLAAGESMIAYGPVVIATDCNIFVRCCRARCGWSRRRIRCSAGCCRPSRSGGGAVFCCWW